MKPGNRLNQELSTVLNLAAIWLKDEKMLVCDANLFFFEEVFCILESIKFDLENCLAPAPSPSGQITFCNKSQRTTFLAEEHLPVGADQGACAFHV